MPSARISPMLPLYYQAQIRKDEPRDRCFVKETLTSLQTRSLYTRLWTFKGLVWEYQDFGVVCEEYRRHPKEDFLIQDGYLFKGTRLCVPKCGTRELLVRVVHARSLVDHYGENKIALVLKEHYYWPSRDKDGQDILRRCATCLLYTSPSPRD